MDPNSSSEEDSTFSTITSLSLTTPRQSEVSSVTTEDSSKSPEPYEDEIPAKFDMLIDQLSRNKQLPAELIKFCRGMKEQYVSQQFPDKSKFADVNKLKSLALKYSDLLSNVDQKSRSMEMLKKANDELNQYISDMENHHTKQVASLKAKISLNRIENEVRLQTPTELPPTVESTSSPVQTKRRRSSILGRFFSKNSGSTLPGVSESKITPTIDHEQATKIVKEELIKKTLKIEELYRKCNDFEQKEKILETAIHDKNIELSVRTNQMAKLKENWKSKSDEDSEAVVMLDKLQDAAESLGQKMERTKSEMKHNRVKVKENQDKVKKLALIVEKTNDENKLLLKKINTKNYELSNKKTSNNKMIKEVKKYLLHVISVAEQHAEDEIEMEEEASKNPTKSSNNINSNEDEELMNSQEQILKRLMKISKTKLSKLLQSKQKLVEDSKKKQSDIIDQACQTTPMQEQTFNNPAKSSEQKIKSDLKKLDDELRRIHQDSGLCISGEQDPFYHHRMSSKLNTSNHHYPSPFNSHQQTVYRVANEERNSPGGPGSSPKPHFSKDFLDYMEFMKNREIESYKEDLKSLERENYQLKTSLDEQNKKVRKLQVDMQYDKSKSSRSPSLPRPSTSPFEATPITRAILTPVNECYKTESYPASPTFDLFNDFPAPTMAPKDLSTANTKNEEDLFFESFDKSSQLIEGIFLERDALERSIEMTRKQRNKGLRV